jgi:hypothetical protein
LPYALFDQLAAIVKDGLRLLDLIRLAADLLRFLLIGWQRHSQWELPLGCLRGAFIGRWNPPEDFAFGDNDTY